MYRWEDRVTIVAADMRHWEAPQQADILVSELLGSFGDNELSPECLDGAQKFLKDGGISIPQSYTSFLQPITTAKLWNDVKVRREVSLLCRCFLLLFLVVIGLMYNLVYKANLHVASKHSAQAKALPCEGASALGSLGICSAAVLLGFAPGLKYMYVPHHKTQSDLRTFRA